MSSPPPPRVLRAFGAVDPPVRLSGGQGVTWRSGDLVLKPVDDEEEVRWRCDLLEHLPQHGFRVPAPVRTVRSGGARGSAVRDGGAAGNGADGGVDGGRVDGGAAGTRVDGGVDGGGVDGGRVDGGWAAGGWTAARWVDGEPGPQGRWPELLAAAEAFHLAVRSVPRPSFLDRRTHAWARGDRAAWGESEPSLPPVVRTVRDALGRHLPPASEPSQLVHGDLAGNVLFHPTQAPAVIDLSPYWRPTGYAAGIAVADGLLTGDGDPELAAAVRRTGRALVARGALFRLHVLHELACEAGTEPRPEELAPYGAIARLLERG